MRAKTSNPEQAVLESDPYRRLSRTWHTFTREWAKGHGFDDSTTLSMCSQGPARAAVKPDDAPGDRRPSSAIMTYRTKKTHQAQ